MILTVWTISNIIHLNVCKCLRRLDGTRTSNPGDAGSNPAGGAKHCDVWHSINELDCL